MNRIALVVSMLLLSSALFAQEKKEDFYDLTAIQEVRIVFDDEDWEEQLDAFKQAGNDERLKADVTINDVLFKNVGVRYKGNSSYNRVRETGSSKLPFNIKLNYKNKKQKLPGGYVTLKLSNAFQDPSFLREVMAYEVAGKYMAASRANFIKVYVNNEYLGLYNSTESVDSRFLKKHFGTKKGPFFKCDPRWGAKEFSHCPESDKASLMYLGQDSLCYYRLYEIKSDTGWADLIELTRILNKEPEKLESILDVNEALWMLAFNNVIVNLDSYNGMLCHNYYLYKDTSGIFHPIIWDMNLAFGGFRLPGLDDKSLRVLSNEKMASMSLFTHYKQSNRKRPLITNLLKNSLYRKIYLAHVKTILEENFSNGLYLERGKEIRTMIEDLVREDENRLYTYQGFEENLENSAKADKKNIVGISELMEPRLEYLQNHRTLQPDGPAIAKVEHIDYESSVAVTSTIEGAERVWLFYRYGSTGRFKRMEMFDDGGHDDQLEGDNIWGTTIESVDGTQYYIVAENEDAANLSPRRAGKEFHKVEK